MQYTHEIGLLISNKALTLIIGAIFCLIIWKWPELGLAFFINLRILNKVQLGAVFLGLSLRLDEVVIVVLLVKLLHLHLHQTDYDRLFLRDPLVISALALTGFTFVQPVLLMDPKLYSFLFSQIQGILMPLFGILILSRDSNRLSRFLEYAFWILLITGIVLLLRVTTEFLYGRPLITMRTLPVWGISVWESGALSLLFIAISYSIFPLRNKVIAWFSGAAIIIAVSLLILGQVRGQWLGALIGVFFLSMRSGKVSRRRLFFSLAFMALLGSILILILVNFAPSYSDALRTNIEDILWYRYQKTFDDLEASDLEGSRLWLWTRAWDAFLESPIWGVGHMNAIGSLRLFKDGTLISYRYSVHNVFLKVLSEEGIFGFLLLMAFLSRIVVIYKQSKSISSKNIGVFRLNLVGTTIFITALISPTPSINYLGSAIMLATNLWYEKSTSSEIDLVTV